MPRAFFHAALLVEESQIDDLILVGGGPKETWYTLMEMRSLASATPQSPDWPHFLARVASARRRLSQQLGEVETEWAGLSIAHHHLLTYFRSPTSRLLPPSVTCSLTSKELDQLLPAAGGNDPAHANFVTVFHLLLQLDSLDFPAKHLCTSVGELIEMVSNARVEGQAKARALFSHLSAPGCMLFTGAPNFVLTPSHVERFRRYAGQGGMSVGVFRALGLESKPNKKEKLGVSAFSAFLIRARTKLASLQEASAVKPSKSSAAASNAVAEREAAKASLIIATSEEEEEKTMTPSPAAGASSKAAVAPLTRAPTPPLTILAPLKPLNKLQPLGTVLPGAGNGESVPAKEIGAAKPSSLPPVKRVTQSDEAGQSVVPSMSDITALLSSLTPDAKSTAAPAATSSTERTALAPIRPGGAASTSANTQRQGGIGSRVNAPVALHSPYDDSGLVSALSTAVAPGYTGRVTSIEAGQIRRAAALTTGHSPQADDSSDPTPDVIDAVKSEISSFEKPHESIEPLVTALKARQHMSLSQRQESLAYLRDARSGGAFHFGADANRPDIHDMNNMVTRTGVSQSDLQQHLRGFERDASEQHARGDRNVGFARWSEFTDATAAAQARHISSADRQSNSAASAGYRNGVGAPTTPSRPGTGGRVSTFASTGVNVMSPSNPSTPARGSPTGSPRHRSLRGAPPPPAQVDAENTKYELFDYLASSSCPLWTQSQNVQHSDLDRLVYAAKGSPQQLSSILSMMFTQGRTFSSVNEMHMAVLKLSRDGGANGRAPSPRAPSPRTDDYSYENFPSVSRTPSPASPSRRVGNVQAGQNVMTTPPANARVVPGAIQTPSSPEARSLALRLPHTPTHGRSPSTPKALTAEEQQVFALNIQAYLNDPACPIWNQPKRVSESEVESLCRLGMGANITWGLIKGIESAKQKLGGVSDLRFAFIKAQMHKKP